MAGRETVIGHLEGHVGGVITLAVNSDVRRAVSAANDLMVRVWDLTTSRCLTIFTIEDFAQACAISVGGRAIAIGTEDRVHLLHLENA